MHLTKIAASFAVASAATAVLCPAAVADGRPPVPPQAAATAGYTTNTFHSVFTAKTVDTAGSDSPGYQWYPTHFYWMKKTDPASMQLGAGDTIVLNSDGSPAGNNNSQICSMSPANTTSGFVGMSFGGGGYFEAMLAFDPDLVFSQRKALDSRPGDAGWPSWWALPVDAIIERSIVQSWSYYSTADVDPKYCNSVETDFMEYDGGPADRDVWGGTLHNWYGPYRYKAINYPYNTSLMRVPVGTDFTKFHKYGFLWIPAQASSSGKVRGYAAYYFDDKLVSTGQQAWDPYCGEAPPPTSEHPAFGVLDRQHLALILGSGIGEPMNVQSVNVWQVSSDWNLGADTLYDIFVDLKKANAVDGPIAIDTSNPELFDGHARRVKRSTAGSASLVYSVPSIRSFAVELFEFNKPSTNVTIDVSADKSHWTNANTRSRVVVPSKHGWGRTDLMNHGKLLSGAGYLRITLSGDKGDPGDCEIGQVRIN